MNLPEFRSRRWRDVVLFATADWHTPYWTNKQHTACEMARQGMRVLYVESPGLRAPGPNLTDLGRIMRRLKDGLREPREVRPGVWVLSPLGIPFRHHWASVRAFNQGLLRWRVQRFMSRHAFTATLAWTYHPFVLETLRRLPHSALVYHCVDDLSAVPGIDLKAFQREEQRLLNAAHAVFTTSTALREKCAAHNPNTHFMPNVVDVDHFIRAHEPGLEPADLRDIPHPRIGYVGALSDFKIDFSLIETIAVQRPEWHWILIGDEREGQHNPIVQRLRVLPNVHALGMRPYASLPDYLRGIDVGTLPTRLNDYTRSMFPMKYFEYLAAGVPVVATPLDFTRDYRAGIEIAADPDSFAQAIGRQIERGRLARRLSIEYTSVHTWRDRLRRMLEIISTPERDRIDD